MGDLNGEQIANAIVERFLMLAETLPQNGLIIDVRGNGGGVIFAGERLLQLLTPHRIAPERLQMLNTPLNLEICKRHAFLTPWVASIQQSIKTGAVYSRAFPITTPAVCQCDWPALPWPGDAHYGRPLL